MCKMSIYLPDKPSVLFFALLKDFVEILQVGGRNCNNEEGRNDQVHSAGMQSGHLVMGLEAN